jgi:hypothetical protein
LYRFLPKRKNEKLEDMVESMRKRRGHEEIGEHPHKHCEHGRKHDKLTIDKIRKYEEKMEFMRKHKSRKPF